MPDYSRWGGPPDAPLDEIQDWVCKHLRPGCICPGCGQHACDRCRHLGWRTMRIYVRAYAIHGQNEFHLSRFIRNYKLARADETKLAFWHLMERVPHPTKPGRYKRGVWRITDFGVLVIEEKRDLPNGRWMYNAQGKDFTDERVTIRDLLAGCPYSLEQLLVSYRLPDEL